MYLSNASMAHVNWMPFLNLSIFIRAFCAFEVIELILVVVALWWFFLLPRKYVYNNYLHNLLTIRSFVSFSASRSYWFCFGCLAFCLPSIDNGLKKGWRGGMWIRRWKSVDANWIAFVKRLKSVSVVYYLTAMWVCEPYEEVIWFCLFCFFFLSMIHAFVIVFSHREFPAI